jgi:hypothetical protein
MWIVKYTNAQINFSDFHAREAYLALIRHLSVFRQNKPFTHQECAKLVKRLSAGFHCTTSGDTNNPERFTRTGLHFGYRFAAPWKGAAWKTENILR